MLLNLQQTFQTVDCQPHTLVRTSGNTPHMDRKFCSHPASEVMDTGDFSRGVTRLGRETDYRTPSSAEVKNGRRYTSAPPCTFTAWFPIFAQGYLRMLFKTI